MSLFQCRSLWEKHLPSTGASSSFLICGINLVLRWSQKEPSIVLLLDSGTFLAKMVDPVSSPELKTQQQDLLICAFWSPHEDQGSTDVVIENFYGSICLC
ncbi:hypothetical protein AVEN_71408-1 [Araneus ventricosus]|uniref:Uncharacterized protein n=1 Tax=Araneus ventricosus TaxID=182803 RepID=A0A4Y2BIK6_ARAVE|nr:hypothetical protein AVEN_71408-1 [Araneus ventricosus]